MNPTPVPRREIAKSRWPQLSPLLDELLDLDATARAARLTALRAQDPTLAEDLQELLARDAAMALAPVLDSPVLLTQGSNIKPGQLLGPYTLEREIGQGGMGTVWLARRTDGRYEGQVAIKFLTSGLLGRGDGGRFAREGQILGRLAHPHIARLLDAGVANDGGPPYLVLEYIDGLPIDRYCEQQALDVAARVTLFLDVLAAVAHAHNRLILHRDLKPSNILVNQAGEVKLLDFGIAKLLGDATQPAAATELTQQAGRAFTPQYAAPEQVQGHDVTTATDVYALGVLLYLLLSGQHPTSGAIPDDSPLARMKAVLEVEPKRLSEQVRGTPEARRARELRGDLDTILAKALKKAAGERYANAETFAADLKRWLAHEPILARPDSAGYRVAKFVRRHRIGVATGAAAVLALSSLTVLSVAQAWRAERAEQQAEARRVRADDLLAYMLGEFADKLRPVGRLELLNSVGGKALGYLSEQDAQLSPQTRLQRAKALTVIGEVRVSNRELDAALEPLKAARQLFGRGDVPPPDGVDAIAWRKAQGAAAFWLGHVHYTRREFEAAREPLSAYLALSRQWLAASPDDMDALIEVSFAENSLGSLLLDQGELSGAERAFEQSVRLKARVLETRPKDLELQERWADSLSWLGSTYLAQGRFAQAALAFEACLAKIADARGQAPLDLKWQGIEANYRVWWSLAQLELGQAKIAHDGFAAANSLFLQLLKQDPNNRLWKYMQVRSELALLAMNGSPPKSASQQLAALADRLAQLDARGKPLPRWHGLRGELARAQLLPGLWDQNDQRSTLQRVQQTRELLAQSLQHAPRDVRTLDALAQLDLALASRQRVDGQPLAAQQICGALRQRIESMHGGPQLVGSHAGITQAWIATLQCLGQTSDKLVQQQRWLIKQKTLLTPLGQAPEPLPR
ncbi:protein kinase domain-containing protein [Paucibacter soli]|uniref:protein kinase domain-containing protein n=1 Tax=Paucibacter soli TaxID=3133433 RepID=UPI0030A16A80